MTKCKQYADINMHSKTEFAEGLNTAHSHTHQFGGQ